MHRSKTVLAYRWVVFALATGYFLYQFTTANYDSFGWQFRFLTIWALTLSVISAGLMLGTTLGQVTRDHSTFASVTAVGNGIVVFMYWKLFLTDPALVNADGPIVWHQEYYLHGLGPVLQWIDVFIICGGFKCLQSTVAGLSLLILTYIVWIEGLVGPRNLAPAGKVTEGMPYPFLNDMTQPERLKFYGGVIIVALFLTCIGWAIARMVERFGLRIKAA